MSVSKSFQSLVAIVFGLTMSLLAACSDEENTARYDVVAQGAEAVGTKTVLVYMAGHNTLGYAGCIPSQATAGC